MIEWKVGDRVMIREYSTYWNPYDEDQNNPINAGGTIVKIEQDDGADHHIQVQWNDGGVNSYRWWDLVPAGLATWWEMANQSGVNFKDVDGDLCAYFCGNKRVNISSIARRCQGDPQILSGIAAAFMFAADGGDV